MTRPFRRTLAALLAPGLLASCVTLADRPAPFTTDGCSLFPDRALVGRADWCDCCLAHDIAYWRGGTEAQRLDADRELRACVARKTGNHALAETMFVGVRAGGGPQLNTPFRWGYAWPYGRGYRALTETESASLQTLESDYRARNPQPAAAVPGRCRDLPPAAVHGHVLGSRRLPARERLRVAEG